jgi:hypothetical protein
MPRRYTAVSLSIYIQVSMEDLVDQTAWLTTDQPLADHINSLMGVGCSGERWRRGRSPTAIRGDVGSYFFDHHPDDDDNDDDGENNEQEESRGKDDERTTHHERLASHGEDHQIQDHQDDHHVHDEDDDNAHAQSPSSSGGGQKRNHSNGAAKRAPSGKRTCRPIDADAHHHAHMLISVTKLQCDGKKDDTTSLVNTEYIGGYERWVNVSRVAYQLSAGPMRY